MARRAETFARGERLRRERMVSTVPSLREQWKRRGLQESKHFTVVPELWRSRQTLVSPTGLQRHSAATRLQRELRQRAGRRRFGVDGDLPASSRHTYVAHADPEPVAVQQCVIVVLAGDVHYGGTGSIEPTTGPWCGHFCRTPCADFKGALDATRWGHRRH